MARRAQDNIRNWARMGAELRLEQLVKEISAIHETFPELVNKSGRDTERKKGRANASAVPRRKMSAAARKRISDAQKARWAKQKAGKK